MVCPFLTCASNVSVTSDEHPQRVAAQSPPPPPVPELPPPASSLHPARAVSPTIAATHNEDLSMLAAPSLPHWSLLTSACQAETDSPSAPPRTTNRLKPPDNRRISNRRGAKDAKKSTKSWRP